jgi:hypothetical protein
LRPRLANHDVPAFEICAVEGFDRSLGLIVGTHLDKAKAFGSPAKLVGDDSRTDHRSVLRKVLLEPFFRNGVGKIPYVQLSSHRGPPYWINKCSCLGIDFSKGQGLKRSWKMANTLSARSSVK